MRAAQLVRAGQPPAFVVDSVADPEPRADEVIVAIRAAALNHRDAWLWQQPDLDLPLTLGSDGAGVVAAVGEDVTGVRAGDEVVVNPGLGWGASDEAAGPEFEILGVPRPGTLAELVAVPAENVHPRPRRLSWAEAATLGTAAVTPWRALERSGVALAGANVLVPGAGGGGAAFAIQLAAALGARVYATSSTDDKLAAARALGAANAVSYRDERWPDALRELCPGGFDLVVDAAGPPLWGALVDLLRPGGTLVTFGLAAGASAEFASFPLLWQWRTIVGTTMGSPRDFARLIDHAERAEWRPAVDSVFELGQMNEAAARLLARDRFGKVVLEVRP